MTFDKEYGREPHRDYERDMKAGWLKPPTKLPFRGHEFGFGRHELFIPTNFGRYGIIMLISVLTNYIIFLAMLTVGASNTGT